MNILGFSPVWERFVPDRTVGLRTLVFAEVDSTMDVARELGGRGAPHGTAVRAMVQLAGRGRFARRWESSVGDSLLVSVVLRLPPLGTQAPVSVAGALAVQRTVDALTGGPVGIKWPNDVEIGGKKIAGVLVESQVATDGTGVAVLGIGLNVNLQPQAFGGIAESATSLAVVCGTTLALDEVEAALFAHLDEEIGSLVASSSASIYRWRHQLTTLGERVTVSTRKGTVVGLAIDVDEHGALVVRSDDGETQVLHEGDVSLRE